MLVALLLLAAACAASAAPRPWIKVTSSNFELFANTGEKRAREAILYFEQVRLFLRKTTRQPSLRRGATPG